MLQLPNLAYRVRAASASDLQGRRFKRCQPLLPATGEGGLDLVIFFIILNAFSSVPQLLLPYSCKPHTATISAPRTAGGLAGVVGWSGRQDIPPSLIPTTLTRPADPHLLSRIPSSSSFDVPFSASRRRKERVADSQQRQAGSGEGGRAQSARWGRRCVSPCPRVVAGRGEALPVWP